jgi:opacity protein-like surface antigen
MAKKSIFVIVLIGLLFVPKAFGQVGLYVGVFGGYSSQKPSLPDASTIFNTNTTFCYGVHAGVKVLMIDVEGTYMAAAHNISWASGLLPDWDQKELDYYFLGLNLKYTFGLAIFHPYLTVGYGYYTADIWNINKATDGGYNFGAGLEVNLSKRIGVVVEGLYHHVTLDISHLSLGLGNFTLTGGLNVYLF